MADDLIPPSPSAEDYYAADNGADDLALFGADDPFELFVTWFEAAKAHEPNDGNAMALATSDKDGLPDVRMVLLKGFDAQGFTFFTNGTSAKGQQLLENPKAAICFHWKSIRRQIRARGEIETVSSKEMDDYFATRSRNSNIGAWASDQSSPLTSREELKSRIVGYEAKFGGADVPRPPHWQGYRLKPLTIEFWRDRAFRLHDRLVFSRKSLNTDWQKTRLYP